MLRGLSRIIFLIIPPIFGLIVGALLLELTVRGALLFQKKEPGWSDRPKWYYAHEQVPSSQDFPYKTPKPSGVFRIGVVGDSFSFAPYMQFDDTFPKKLERMLNLNETELRGEVLNYGVPAYSLSHEVAVVKKAIQDEVDLLLLQVTLNDPEIKHHRPTGIQANLPDRFGAFQPTGAWKSVLSVWKTAGLLAEQLHNRRTRQLYEEYFLDLFNNPRSWNGYVEALDKILRRSKKADVPVVAVIFPLFGLPLDDKYPFWSIHEKVGTLFESRGVPHIDLQSIYKSVPLARLQVIPGVDRHPNEIGHRMAAEAIYDWLVAEGHLPKELHIQERFLERMGLKNRRLLE